jgi:arsenate reductase
MAEALVRRLRPEWEVYSAGTEPAPQVHPYTVEVMREVGIDMSNARPKSVDRFVRLPFDYVITVCDHARETCPVFLGEVRHRLHIGFDDPAEAVGSKAEILAEFRRVRDEIRDAFERFVREVESGLEGEEA